MENKNRIGTACLFCSSSLLICLGSNPDFLNIQVYTCKSCHAIFSTPVPNDNELALLYEKEYRSIRKEKPDEKYLSLMDKRALAQKKIIEPYIKKSNAYLDIGSGAGCLLSQFADKFESVEGYEPDKIMYNTSLLRGKDNMAIHNSMCVISSLPNDHYDLITLSHVLEHIPRPQQFLSELITKLSDVGVLFIEVPNDDETTVKEMIAMNVKGLMHLNFFNKKSFMNIFDGIGQVLHIHEYGASKTLFRVAPPNTRSFKRFIVWKVYKMFPRLSKRIGIPNVTSSFEVAKHFESENKTGIYLRIILSKM